MKRMPKKKSLKEPLRKIYNKNYYKAQIMLRDPWFVKKVETLKQQFADADCPLPKIRFKTPKEYGVWVEDFKKKSLQPTYDEVRDEILKRFQIAPDHKGFRRFIENNIFFGQKEYHTSLFEVTIHSKTPDERMGLYIQIFPHTKKEDILKHWDWIASMQANKGSERRTRKWTEFERDLEVYTTYKGFQRGKKRQKKPLDLQTVEKYPELSLSMVRTIISRTARRLGE